jgi:hypothetical protein
MPSLAARRGAPISVHDCLRAARVDDLRPKPFGKPRGRDLTVMGDHRAAAHASGGASMGAIWPCHLISKRRQSDRALGGFLPSEGDLKRAS